MKLEMNSTPKEARENRERMTFQEIPGFKKKAQYIWDYYHKPFIVLVIIAAMVISAGVSIYNNLKYETVFYCSLINNVVTDEDTDLLETDFAAYYDLDTSCEKVVFDSTLRINYSPEDLDTEASYVSYQKFSAMISARIIDCTISDNSVTSVWAEGGTFYNLEELLPADVLSQISDHLVYYTMYEDENDTTGTYAPYAVDLSGTKWAKNSSIYLKQPLFSIVINAKYPDAAVAFIKYAFGL